MGRALNARHSTAGVALERKDKPKMIKFNRTFTHAPKGAPARGAASPAFDGVYLNRRDAHIKDDAGDSVFVMRDVIFPEFWSQRAIDIVASKYFKRSRDGSQDRTIVDMLCRVAYTIADWGVKDGYFDEENANIFADELMRLCVQQAFAFNSPVWFNVGVEEEPQCSACFINSVEDTMESILGLARTEGMLFKWGSGTGSNLSTIRSSKERLQGGGSASGPVSFMKGFDSFAGAIKSGGKTRRAAKMVILNIGHPDVMDFIRCKAEEEKKAHALIDAGYSGEFNAPGGAYDSVSFQNANHTVRVTDAFMAAVDADEEWSTFSVTTGEVVDTYKARELMDKIAEAAWFCGDPGIQFDDTINKWNPNPGAGRINASNPCSEYMYLDDSACNLGSLNLKWFHHDAAGGFNVEAFQAAIRIVLVAQDILVGRAAYPTPKIAENSHRFRPLGLGYANLGALLMSQGIAYDSEKGRDYAATLTDLMHGTACLVSTELAEVKGMAEGLRGLPPEDLERVLTLHAEASRSRQDRLSPDVEIEQMGARALTVWDGVLLRSRRHGIRNGQVTALAPTGTIAFMMDCDTTGIEPDIALVKYKKLVGGGTFKIVNESVDEALAVLGYALEARRAIRKHIEDTDTIEGAPGLLDEHLPIFDCAFRPAKGTRSLPPMAHILMMKACQPFISGAISKTVNVPSDATPGDIKELYRAAWAAGLKSVAIYRDGCKRTQPLNTSRDPQANQGAFGANELVIPVAVGARAVRRKLPVEREARTHKFDIAGHEGYITAGLYEDQSVGEIFLVMAKEGSTISGLMDAFATAVSLALQYGVPLSVLCEKFSHMRFEPSGFTGNPELPIAKSIMDYIFRWLDLRFGSGRAGDRGASTAEVQAGLTAAAAPPQERPIEGVRLQVERKGDGPPCTCGTIMVRVGPCFRCDNCGSSSGCG